MKLKNGVNKTLLYILISVYTVLIMFPLLIIVIPTFQTIQESSQGILKMPSQFNFNNYFEGWKQSNFHIALKNSLLITGLSLIINVVLGSMAAFPMAIRENKRIYKIMFFTFLFGLMLPFQAIMIPLYVLMGRVLKMTNTYSGVIVVYVAMTLPLTIFFYTQFIKTVSKEMEEASIIDGCGYFKMFWTIFFPLLKPVTAAIIIQNMLFLWNDLLVPLLLIDKAPLKPIMPSVYMFFGTYYNQWNLAFSVLILAALPFLALFLALQKQFIQGLSAGAVKG
ncbi:MAG: carbohydrate ABC transporter permease [Actinobacteria bacterium]|nr:carbohydrate ABC transporter permease [Actinomycetota bacterium]